MHPNANPSKKVITDTCHKLCKKEFTDVCHKILRKNIFECMPITLQQTWRKKKSLEFFLRILEYLKNKSKTKQVCKYGGGGGMLDAPSNGLTKIASPMFLQT